MAPEQADTCTSPVGGSKCGQPARCAIRTTRPRRDDLRITYFSDNRTAPRSAQRYCRKHGIELLAGLAHATTDMDQAEEGAR